MARCESCQQLYHNDCMNCLEKPLLFGDNNFIFKCSVCTGEEEYFVRNTITWTSAVELVLYHLTKQRRLGTQGKQQEHYYFRFKTEICETIDAYADLLFVGKQRNATWRNTVASTLSTHPKLFLSAATEIGDGGKGWWSLKTEQISQKSHARTLPNSATPVKRLKKRKNSENDLETKVNKKRSIKEELIDISENNEPTTDDFKLEQINESNKQSAESDSNPISVDPVPLSATNESEKNHKDSEDDNDSSNRVSAADKDNSVMDERNLNEILKYETISDVENEDSRQDDVNPIVNNSNIIIPTDSNNKSQDTNNIDNIQKNKENLKSKDKKNTAIKLKTNTIKPLTSQDEWQYLQILDHAKNPLPPIAARYKRKLALRRLKQSLNLKLFDLDHYVGQHVKSKKNMVSAAMYDMEEQKQKEKKQKEQQAASTALEQLTCTKYCNSFASRLYGYPRLSNTITADKPWLSQWNGRKLRPYIRRDYENKPARMLLLEQIKAVAGIPKNINDINDQLKKNLLGEKSNESSIDYVYLQKKHLELVNNLLERCFWDGIDVSESLLFPEYSIVALYKRCVIGCAFMTPDAYITYFAVLPGWERAGIGQFMLYHLFQTAIGKDVTLHVSANNNAMILYQKFGFKPEEFIVNFYDKYLPAESSFSKNAFFLRLRR
ncbi:unnamed protein product [Cunninghamella echinulata]